MINQVKTFTLLAALTALVIYAGYAIGGQSGLMLALGISFFMNVASYFYSDKIVIASSRGEEANESEMPWLYEMVRNLCQKANLPMPKIYIIPETQPNAFATGRDEKHAALGLTAGIIKLLPREQLEAVIGHELTHIKSRDILIASVAAVLGSSISILGNMLFFTRSSDNEEGGGGNILFLILAPILATIIQLAISRSREYIADAGGASLTSKSAMAEALKSINGYGEQIAARNISPSTAHMYISNPFHGGMLSSLFSTHPSLEQRLAALDKI